MIGLFWDGAGFERCIMYIVKRTQLYMDDEIIDRLKELGERRGTTMSALVRDAVRQTYFQFQLPENWRKLLKSAEGSWKDEPGRPDPDRYIRELRKDSRPQRLSK